MLLIDAKAAHERLQTAQAARTNLDEANALIDLHKSLAEKSSKLHALVVRAVLLAEAGVPLSASPDVAPIRKTIDNLRNRFDTQPKSNTLTQGKHWNALLAALAEASASLEANQRQDWTRYVTNHLFGGLPPERRKVGLVPIPSNELALNQYTRLYDKFSRYRNVVPATKEVLDEVHRLSEALALIAFKEKDDVPEAVAAFINAASLGASLRLLSAEVIDWLHENDLLDSYVVRARA